MVKKLYNFELFKKKFTIYFIILFSILNAWYLNVANNHYNLVMNLSLEINQQLENDFNLFEPVNIDYQNYLKEKITIGEEISAKDEQNFKVLNELNFDKYLLEHNIEPLNIGLEFNHIGSINGATSIYVSIKETLPFVIPFIPLVLAISCFQKSKKSDDYLMTLPIKKTNIFKARFYSIISISFLSIIIILLLAFLRGIVIGGIGDFQYPVLLNTSFIDSNIVNHYIPLWLFIIISLCIIFVQMLMYSLIGVVIVKLFKNKWFHYFNMLILSMIPVIYTFISNNPLHSNFQLTLVPFLSDQPFYLITYGFPLFIVFSYFGLVLFVFFSVYKMELNNFGRTLL